MLLRPGVCDTGRPVVGAQPTHLRRQQRQAGRSIRIGVVVSGEHTGGEGALKAIDRSSELVDVGVLDDDGDGTEALLEQPAAVLQSIDRRLKDRSRRTPAATDASTSSTTRAPANLNSSSASAVDLAIAAVSMIGSRRGLS